MSRTRGARTRAKNRMAAIEAQRAPASGVRGGSKSECDCRVETDIASRREFVARRAKDGRAMRAESERRQQRAATPRISNTTEIITLQQCSRENASGGRFVGRGPGRQEDGAAAATCRGPRWWIVDLWSFRTGLGLWLAAAAAGPATGERAKSCPIESWITRHVQYCCCRRILPRSWEPNLCNNTRAADALRRGMIKTGPGAPCFFLPHHIDRMVAKNEL